MAILGLLSIGGATALPMLGPLLENDVTAAGLCVALAGVLWAVTTAGIRSSASKRFQTLMRALYPQLFRQPPQAPRDPIADMQQQEEGLTQDVDALNQQLTDLTAIIDGIKGDIESNVREADQALRSISGTRGKARSSVLHSRQAVLLRDSNQTLSEMVVRLEQLREQVTTVRDDSEATRNLIKQTIRVKTRERAALQRAASAIQAVSQRMEGDFEKQAAFNQATEQLADDFAMRIGRIRAFTTTTQEFVDTLDVNAGVYRGEALELLEEWKANGDSALAGDGGEDESEADAPPLADLSAFDVKPESGAPKPRPKLTERSK